MYVILNDELYHHGIKGQKWGVRRFQNADGTRTESGKQRYGSKREEKEARKREAINEYSKVMDSYNRAKKKSEEIWEEARAKYESLGPDDASRFREERKAELGRKGAKKAAKEYFELSKKSEDVLDEAWERKREAEKRLGKSVVKAYNKEIKRQEKEAKRSAITAVSGKPTGVLLTNGDILFVDSNDLLKYGHDKAVQIQLARNKEAERKRKKKTELSDEELELEKELLRDDTDYARALKDIKKRSIDVEAEKKKVQDAKKNKRNYVDPDGNEWTIY